MMKKNNYDFTVPHRQSFFSIVMILWKTIRVIAAQIFPILLVLLFGKTSKSPTYLVIAAIIIGLLAMVISIIQYFKTYFYIADHELIVHKGILKKTKTTIPFEKIQSIQFQQNVVQQMLEVTQLNIETAGSEKTEFAFHAIEEEKAHALRDYIFSHKQPLEIATDDSLPTVTTETHHAYRKIMSLEIFDLLKVGFTENHIKSFWVIIIFFYWIFQNLQEAGMDVEAYSEQVSEWNWTFRIVMILMALLLISSLLISLIRVTLSNFDLQFLRSENGFKITRGLLSKKEISVPDQKIQIISWADNLLKAAIGFKDLYLSQASSTRLSTKQLIKIPGCSQTHVQEVMKEVMGDIQLENIQMHGVRPQYFTRFTMILSLIVILPSIIFYYINDLSALFMIWILGFYLIIARYLAYRKKRYGFNESTLYIRGGKWGHRADVMQVCKVQGVKIRQNPFQRRHNLCNISLFTASGQLVIPYIPVSDAHAMIDVLMFTLETSRKPWM